MTVRNNVFLESVGLIDAGTKAAAFWIVVHSAGWQLDSFELACSLPQVIQILAKAGGDHDQAGQSAEAQFNICLLRVFLAW